MRVVHVINSLPRVGGAERLVLDLARCSAEKPVPVIAWWSTDNGLLELDTEGCIDLIALRPFSFAALRRAVRALSQAQVVHVHLFPSLYLAPLIPKPVLYTEHNTWNRRRDRPWLRPVERWCYRRLAKVVSISIGTEAALREWLGESPRGSEVIPNGISLERFEGALRSPPQGPEVVLGMVARFAPEKDQETLLRALPLLPSRYRLVLGGDGRLRPEAEALARSLGLGERVKFVGVVHDVQAFFRSIDLYVQSSNADGFSIVTVEAMACGLPVIASDIDGLRDTVGRAEQLFPHRDAEALARLVRRIVEDPEAYRAASRHALENARRFDVRRTAERYERAYAAAAASVR